MKPLWAPVAGVLVTVSLAACGGGGTSPTATSTSASHATASSGVPTAPTTTTGSPTAPQATTGAPTANTGATGTTTAPSTAGGSSAGGDSGAVPPAPPSRRYPHGDNSVQTYGIAAGESDRKAVTAAVKHYYAVLAAGDYATACTLLSSSMSSLIAKGLGRSPSLRGKGCAGILSLFLDPHAGASLGAVRVTGVRVKRDRGFALLRSAQMPAGEIPVQREGGVWKMGGVIGGPLS